VSAPIIQERTADLELARQAVLLGTNLQCGLQHFHLVRHSREFILGQLDQLALGSVLFLRGC